MSFLAVQLLSGLGVLLTIALTWLVGWSRPARIGSLEVASRRFAADFPAVAARGGALDAAGKAALLELGDSVGLVTVAGDRMVTRRLHRGEVRAGTEGDVLSLVLADPTMPRLVLSLPGGEAARWAARFGGRT